MKDSNVRYGPAADHAVIAICRNLDLASALQHSRSSALAYFALAAKTRAMGRLQPFVFLTISAIFVAGGVLLLVYAHHDPEKLRVGLTTILFFGGCAVVGLAELRKDNDRDAARARRAQELNAATFKLNGAHLQPMALGAALMGAGGALMGTLGAPIWLAWLCGVFFGGGGLFMGFIAFDRRRYVVVDSEGVFDRRLFRSKAPWTSIQAISIDWNLGSIELHLAEGAAATPCARPFLVLRPPQRLRISASVLDGGLDEVLAAIHRFRPDITMLSDLDFDDDDGWPS